MNLGKIFEGNTSQMISSLLMLSDFPPDTIIFPGHEYAKLNLSFALSLEKDNDVLNAVNKAVHEKRTVRSPIVSFLNILFNLISFGERKEVQVLCGCFLKVVL